MSDFFQDPDYPNRPQSQDYWRLVELVNKFDGDATEGGRSVDDIAGDYIDPEALTYTAIQRALRMEMASGGAVPSQYLAPIWVEAFLVGVAFQQAGGHRDETSD